MRIALDIRGIDGNKGGKGVWTMNVLKALLSTDKKNNFHLYTNKASSAAWKELTGAKIILIKGSGFAWHWKFYKRLLQDKIDVLIATESYIVPFLHDPKKLKVGMVVHDLVAFKSPAKHQKWATFIERLTLKRAVKKARWIFTVSDYTRKDLLERYPHLPLKNKTHVVYAGVRDVFLKTRDEKRIRHAQERYGLNSAYLMMAGTLEPRKNILGAIQAYQKLSAKHQKKYRLLIVGKKGWYYEQIFEAVQKLDLLDRVLFLEYISDEDLVALMQGATVFLFPSFYEGFGLPVLEAMANGVPVLASRVTSIPELGLDAIHYINPKKVKEITQGISRLLEDKSYAQQLVKKGLRQVKKFTWKKTAQRILSAIGKN